MKGAEGAPCRGRRSGSEPAAFFAGNRSILCSPMGSLKGAGLSRREQDGENDAPLSIESDKDVYGQSNDHGTPHTKTPITEGLEQ